MSDPASQFSTWIQKAEEDRLCIANNMAATVKPWSLLCYHSQQAVEKYLKAFLIAHGEEVTRTHDLEFLLGKCRVYDESLETLNLDCQALSSYAVDSRYPDVLSTDVEGLARDAIDKCNVICSEIGERLKRT